MKKLIIYALGTVIALVGLASVPSKQPVTIKELMTAAESRIVVLNDGAAKDPVNSGGGTGFQVVAPSGHTYVVTNRHVCQVSTNGYMIAQLEYHGRLTQIKILEISDEDDLCILSPLPQVGGYIVSKEPLDKYESIYTIGHGLLKRNHYSAGINVGEITVEINEQLSAAECHGPRLSLKKQTISFFGMAFSVELCIRDEDLQETNVVIYPGNSGSPVFSTLTNKIVGVMNAADGNDKRGLMVPVERLVKFLSKY